MATGELVLIPVKLDDTAPPGVIYEGVGNNLKFLFADGADEIIYYSFTAPANYNGSPALKITYAMRTSTSGNVVWACQVMKITPGAAASWDTPSFDAANTVVDGVPGTVKFPADATLTLTNNDSMVAGDKIWLKFYRDGDHASDDATPTGDAELGPMDVRFQYTTT